MTRLRFVHAAGAVRRNAHSRYHQHKISVRMHQFQPARFRVVTAEQPASRSRSELRAGPQLPPGPARPRTEGSRSPEPTSGTDRTLWRRRKLPTTRNSSRKLYLQRHLTVTTARSRGADFGRGLGRAPTEPRAGPEAGPDTALRLQPARSRSAPQARPPHPHRLEPGRHRRRLTIAGPPRQQQREHCVSAGRTAG
jgi:hypothetical protein